MFFKTKRKNFFINKEMQGRYMMKVFIIFAICLAVMMLIFNGMSADTLSISYEDYELILDSSPNVLWKKMASSIWIVAIFGGGVLLTSSMFLTHKLAGPMFRFEKCLKSMKEKDLTDHIKLRLGDEGTELAEHINEFNHMLGAEFEKMKDVSDRIHQDLILLKEKIDDSHVEEKKRFIKLCEDCDLLNNLLIAFKTEKRA